MNKRKYLITVAGPTAIGKSALAIQLAQHFNTEIISADSRQFYKEMAIGTAVPSKEELATVPHHFIQHKSIFDTYTVGDFERDAIEKLHVLFKKHTVIIMAGGSGLYINAVLNGLDDFPEVDPQFREQLNNKFREEGIEALQEQLREADPDYFKVIDLQNPHRLIRALEICMGTRRPYSSFLRKKEVSRSFIPVLIGLIANRELIYDRINQRVDVMLQKGLLAEAQQLYVHKQLNALQTVGYKELFHFFDGKCTLEEATFEIKKNTRRFAKRQLTWFRRNEQTIWFDLPLNVDAVVQEISHRII